MLSIMGKLERTQKYGNEIHCHVYTFAKFQENTTILSYIHVQYTIDTIYVPVGHSLVSVPGTANAAYKFCSLAVHVLDGASLCSTLRLWLCMVVPLTMHESDSIVRWCGGT